MNRPLLQCSIRELEAELNLRHDDEAYLRQLAHELTYRSTSRAKALLEKVKAALRRLESEPRKIGAETSALEATGPTGSKRAEPRFQAQLSRAAVDLPSIAPYAGPADEPLSVLAAWSALEVLSPRPFKPSDFDRSVVISLDLDHLPWEGNGEKARPRTQLYYQVAFGTIDLGSAVDQLLSVYSDKRAERPAARGEALAGIVVLDRRGRLIETPAVSISSFAWGLPVALRGELGKLAAWQQVERDLAEELEEVLRRAGRDEKDGEVLPLNRSTLLGAWEWLVRSLDLPPTLVSPPRVAIRSYVGFRSSDPPEPMLLNSSFLEDLSRATGLCQSGKDTFNLRRYLGLNPPKDRSNLLQDAVALEAAVAPSAMPAARWPSVGDRALALLQQAAVNLSFRELRDRGILAVNGPPGTGKTTLLRDLVAGILMLRADQLATYEDPESAFQSTGLKMKAGTGWLHLYRLDSRLKGFEILVASSNNRAVENVSTELPDRKSIGLEVRYLRTLSDALIGEGATWGLIAGVLGNRANCSRFVQTFWWDEDCGLQSYLAEVAGTPRFIETPGSSGAKKDSRRPKIVTLEDPPSSRQVAMQRWSSARATYLRTKADCQRRLAELERDRATAIALRDLLEIERSLLSRIAQLRSAEDLAAYGRSTVMEAVADSERAAAVAACTLSAFDEVAPGILARLLRTKPARDWSRERAPLAGEVSRTRQELLRASQALAAAEDALRRAERARSDAEREYRDVSLRLAEARVRVAEAKGRRGTRFVDQDFLDQPPEVKQLATPWLDEEAQRLRDRTFVAAIELHKAFLGAAAKPLRHNLGVFTKILGGGTLPTPEKRALLPDLWSSFSLVVPVVSSTFASVSRMLSGLPEEALGWLLIDEAGQATPQSAVGAILRSRRAVVVGDPAQIEPVVILPDSLTQAICRHFRVDPDRFNAPEASVQSLADAATPFFAEFSTPGGGSREVGVPLLVHRRCADPMFRISNRIAYGGLMVQAKQSKPSPIGKVLGPSAWVDVRGGSADKWCAEEGDILVGMLRRLAEAELVDVPNLYVVTPFVVVSQNLRRLVGGCDFFSRWRVDPKVWAVERIGTVHTVQGREAEAVVLVLGAPSPSQHGARTWAGSSPNLLNVAVTRAKERLYVVGNRSLWREAGVFGELDRCLPEG